MTLKNSSLPRGGRNTEQYTSLFGRKVYFFDQGAIFLLSPPLRGGKKSKIWKQGREIKRKKRKRIGKKRKKEEEKKEKKGEKEKKEKEEREKKLVVSLVKN